MSAYPPPPPPPPAGPPFGAPYGQYPPPYDKRAQKEQQRLLKQQLRMQREQLKMEARRLRRPSVVGPLILLTLGVVFLLVQLGRFSWASVLGWYGRWWPLVIIVAGVLLLAEWAIDQQSSSPRRVRSVGGGVITLLIFMAIFGAFSHTGQHALEWKDREFGAGFPGFDFALGDRHDYDDEAGSAIAEGGALVIRNPHGDVTVTGSSTDGQVHVSSHKEVYAHNDGDARERESNLQPVFSGDANNLVLEVADVQGGKSDLTIEVPRTTPLTVRVEHGAIDLQELHAAVSLTSNSGEVSLSGIDGPVNAHINDRDSSVSMHSVTGGVTVDGHTGDINVSNVNGPVSLHGDFFGTTHLERVSGTVSFKTSRTEFSAARIDGDFDISADAEMEASQVLGPVVLNTRDHNITLDRVQGDVQISNRNGSVSITNAAPLGRINIANRHGSVDVGLPDGAGFALNAQTENGDIENDFGLKGTDSDHRNVLTGTVARGGPAVTLATTDGDVTVRKATVVPLPPAPPAPPQIVPAPAAPKAPHAPKAPSSPKAPPAPKAPSAPKSPPAPAAPPAA